MSGSVSLVALKGLAQRTLPPSSHLRELLLSQPDRIGHSEAAAKIPVFSELLELELKELRS
ncbi:MAG: hypothetical protein ABI361_03375 [Nitrososphaera sp.]|jgi:hypothetical protein